MRKYNETNICDRCKKEKLVPGKARREYKGKERTGKWLCNKCGLKDDYKERYLTNYKINNLDINSAPGRGRIYEQITCKTRGIDNLNIKNDNFHSPIDHSIDPELGIIQTKGCTLGIITRDIEGWSCSWKNEHHKIFNYLVFYCMDENAENVLRVYIFPKDEIIKRVTVKILKNSSKGWYQKYRVCERPYNDAYHNLNKEDLKGLRRNKSD